MPKPEQLNVAMFLENRRLWVNGLVETPAGFAFSFRTSRVTSGQLAFTAGGSLVLLVVGDTPP